MAFELFLLLFIVLVIAGILNWRRTIKNNRKIKNLEDENKRLNQNEDSRDIAYRKAFSNKPAQNQERDMWGRFESENDDGAVYDTNGRRVN